MSHKIRNRNRREFLSAKAATDGLTGDESSELHTLTKWCRSAYEKRNWKAVAEDRACQQLRTEIIRSGFLVPMKVQYAATTDT